SRTWGTTRTERGSAAQHLPQAGRELDRLVGRLTVLAAAEPAVTAGEHDRLRAQALCGPAGGPAGHLVTRRLAHGDQEPGYGAPQVVVARLVGGQRHHVDAEHEVVARPVVLDRQAEHRGVGVGLRRVLRADLALDHDQGDELR